MYKQHVIMFGQSQPLLGQSVTDVRQPCFWSGSRQPRRYKCNPRLTSGMAQPLSGSFTLVCSKEESR